MTRRRTRRRIRPGEVFALALLAIAGIDALAHAGYVVLLLAAAVAYVLLVIRPGVQRPAAPPRQAPAVPAAPAAAVPSLDAHRRKAGQLAAENDDLRRQVAKLEQDAAAHDDLIERIEAVTGRRVELHLAALEKARGLYGNAAFGGRQ
jgi:hypothetical protein